MGIGTPVIATIGSKVDPWTVYVKPIPSTGTKRYDIRSVSYFGDDFGWGVYTFIDCTIGEAVNYLAAQNLLTPDFTDYKISEISERKRYWFFGVNIITIEMTRHLIMLRQPKLNYQKEYWV